VDDRESPKSYLPPFETSYFEEKQFMKTIIVPYVIKGLWLAFLCLPFRTRVVLVYHDILYNDTGETTDD